MSYQEQLNQIEELEADCQYVQIQIDTARRMFKRVPLFGSELDRKQSELDSKKREIAAARWYLERRIASESSTD